MHEEDGRFLNPEHPVVLFIGQISNLSIHCMDFFENVNAPLDLHTIYFSRSTIYFSCFTFLSSYYSIL